MAAMAIRRIMSGAYTSRPATVNEEFGCTPPLGGVRDDEHAVAPCLARPGAGPPRLGRGVAPGGRGGMRGALRKRGPERHRGVRRPQPHERRRVLVNLQAR